MSCAEAASARRAGFTLVELLIALLIGVILMTVVFQMISGQSRTVAVQSSREEAQQNVRGALEVISADLRGAFPAGIVEAQARQITFMQPRAWGIICGVAGNTIDAVFPVTNGPLPDDSEASGVIVNSVPPPGATWSPLPPTRAPIIDVNVLPGGPTAGLCNDDEVQGAAQVIQITTNSVTATAAAAAVGNQIATYHMTRYDLAQDDGAWWIRRSMGMDAGTYNMQPLAGPAEADGLSFSYHVDSGDASMPVPGTDAVALGTIRMISVQAMTKSSQELNGNVQRDSGSVRVMLRNVP